MTYKKLKITLIIIVLSLILAPALVTAADIKLQVPFGSVTSVTGLTDYVRQIYQYLVGVAGILTVVMFMYGGLRWMTALGNAEKIGKAKDTLLSALTGFLLTFLSWVILSAINPNIVELKAPAISTIERAEESEITSQFGGIWGPCDTYPSCSEERFRGTRCFENSCNSFCRTEGGAECCGRECVDKNKECRQWNPNLSMYCSLPPPDWCSGLSECKDYDTQSKCESNSCYFNREEEGDKGCEWKDPWLRASYCRDKE